MATHTFVNLPVKDVAKTTDFFKGLGFSFNEQFSDETTKCMVISDSSYAMLHVEPVFKNFTQQDVTDTSQSREVIIGLSADSREHVDDVVGKAVAGGGQALGGPIDEGYMYMQAFRDLDGHQWSFIYMDMSAIPQP
jgi:uncharacterized protein